ncbi:MAG: hypothetical protein IJI66_13235 [Erysipelotrichaceae bacterium]|nr:hypothetical protein [Erysipelotrichaceae bacterium]
MIKNGTMTGTVLNDEQGQTKVACDSVLKLLAGEEINNKVNYVPYVMITKENAAIYVK